MGTTRVTLRPTAVAAGVALALAGCATLSFAVGDAIGYMSLSTEAVFTLSWLVGWVLLVWAAIVGGAVSIQLIRAGVASRRPPALIETALMVATIAVVSGAAWTHPLVGSGTGVG